MCTIKWRAIQYYYYSLDVCRNIERSDKYAIQMDKNVYSIIYLRKWPSEARPLIVQNTREPKRVLFLSDVLYNREDYVKY